MEIFWKFIIACIFLWNNVNSQTIQIPEKGFSDQYKSENTLGQYTFGYNEDHASGGSFRRETGDQYGNKIGSYGLRVADGRVRIVNYVADHNGYRADVVSNEPGHYTHRHNGFFGIDKTNIYGVAIPGLRFSGEAPYLTFSNAHQQVPVETAHQEQAANWEDSVQDLVVEDEPLYTQAYAITDEVTEGGKMVQKSIDFEAAASNERLNEVTENNFIDGNPEQVGESRNVETAVESSTSNNSTDVTTTAAPTKD
ncbi:Cuticle protein 14 isoform b like protein [Argiope bruennichi]|uniref:Cuticle protein 14 isoform b like protein n=1 Tax=Argiope bruennichi TaxID=94029 RepID=A0A8T0E7F6_ARGBR|nr:Cuticle protein 14 isoform b like protein [Argiope bruennichi]